MGKNRNKLYDKAINYHRNGKLKKALECCEKGIAKDLKNRDILNLKGLLLYIKGDLNEAIAVWRVNSDFNNDEIARVYIKDAKDDRRKLDLFNEAKSDVNNYNIDIAIDKLSVCNTSDFNSINVNYLLAICYLRKGNYKISKEYIDKALSLDCENKLVLDLDKENREFYGEGKRNIKIPIVASIVGIIATFSLIVILNNIRNSTLPEKDIAKEDNIIIDTSSNENIIEENIIDTSNNEINNQQDNNEIIESEKENDENKVKNYTHEELGKVYITASDLFSKKDYDGAINILKDIYDNSTESYLNAHILYLFANSYQCKNDKDNSNKYFEMYVEKYYGESYIQEALYNLAMNYHNVDDEKAKKYANQLANDYKESIYLNNNIKNILNK